MVTRLNHKIFNAFIESNGFQKLPGRAYSTKDRSAYSESELYSSETFNAFRAGYLNRLIDLSSPPLPLPEVDHTSLDIMKCFVSNNSYEIEQALDGKGVAIINSIFTKLRRNRFKELDDSSWDSFLRNLLFNEQYSKGVQASVTIGEYRLVRRKTPSRSVFQ